MKDADREDIAIEMGELKKLCKEAHERAIAGRIATRAFCSCGCSGGGPSGLATCAALRRIKFILESISPTVDSDTAEEIGEIIQHL